MTRVGHGPKGIRSLTHIAVGAICVNQIHHERKAPTAEFAHVIRGDFYLKLFERDFQDWCGSVWARLELRWRLRPVLAAMHSKMSSLRPQIHKSDQRSLFRGNSCDVVLRKPSNLVFREVFAEPALCVGQGKNRKLLIERRRVPCHICLHERLELFLQAVGDRKSTRLNSSHQIISYAVFCLKKKQNIHQDMS